MSTITTDPARVPVAVGVNVTEIWQLAPALAEVPHVLDSAKSPLAEIDAIASATVPVFESITVCAALVVFSVRLAKVKLAGDSDTAGVPAPVPESRMACGLPVALSVRMMVPV